MITVTDLFRYPVKSMQGLSEAALDLVADGFEGDRRWALIDGATGRLMSAKRWSALLMASADDEAITLPDGERVPLGAPDADKALSAWLGREVHLAEATADTEVSYEMTFEPPNDEAEYVEIPTTPGSFLDLTAAHLASRRPSGRPPTVTMTWTGTCAASGPTWSSTVTSSPSPRTSGWGPPCGSAPPS